MDRDDITEKAQKTTVQIHKQFNRNIVGYLILGKITFELREGVVEWPEYLSHFHG